MSDEVADETTERIRAAALQLFVEVGFGSANVDQIAARAEVGVATVYRRWPDKAALANDLLASTIEQMEELLQTPEAPTPKQRFMIVWQRFWTYAYTEPRRFLLLESHINVPYMSEENRRRKNALNERATLLLHDVGVNASPPLAVAFILGTLVAIIRDQIPTDHAEVGERLWSALHTAPRKAPQTAGLTAQAAAVEPG